MARKFDEIILLVLTFFLAFLENFTYVFLISLRQGHLQAYKLWGCPPVNSA